MLGCFNSFKMEISLIAVEGIPIEAELLYQIYYYLKKGWVPSSSLSSFIFLSATNSFETESFAL